MNRDAEPADVRRDLLRELARAIVAIERPHPVRVAIDGVDAAGKTTMADELAPLVEDLGRPVVRASADHFLHPAAVRRRREPLSPEGYYRDSFDYASLKAALLEPLGPGGPLVFSARRRRARRAADRGAARARRSTRDSAAGRRLPAPCRAARLLRLLDFPEGGLRCHRPARDAEAIGDPEALRRRYEARYVPGQRLYLAEVGPERLATIVVDNNDYARPFIVSR